MAARRGRLDDAHERAVATLALAQRTRQGGNEAWALRLLGEIALRQAPADAAEHFDHAARLATELGLRPVIAHCHAGLAKLYSRTGKRTESDEHLAIATTMYRDMGMTYWLEKAEAEAAGE